MTTPKLNVKLLRKIQKHITEEPRRFYMDWFVHEGIPGTQFETEYHVKQRVPPCGTTACIAGWAWKLSGHDDMRDSFLSDKAADILGLPFDKWRLFWDCDWPEPYRSSYAKTRTAKTRAKIACERIDHLIKTGE